MTTVDEILATIHAKAEGGGRLLVGIAGPPGVGKSTLADTLCTRLTDSGYEAAIVPMDGFHLDNDVLRQRGLLDRKGAPETFDAEGFVSLVARLRENRGPIAIPLFDREADCVRPDAQTITRSSRILLLEGNYLLLDRPPWSRIPPLLDLSVFISASMETLRSRLIHRWLEHGYDTIRAEKRAESNDIPNAKLVLEHSRSGDLSATETGTQD